MAPTTQQVSWKELKKNKKKWKEERLLKKLKKQEILELESTKSKDLKKEVNNISTVSIAIPGSILDNAQSDELRTYLAGQIARAACMFHIDEVVVFDDNTDEASSKKSTVGDGDEVKKLKRCCVQLGRILQYLECPQYFRKHIFPIHKDLQYAGVLNPLDAPHHLRQNDKFLYREGLVTNKPVKEGYGSQVNVGLLQDVTVDKVLPAGVRCTVKLLPQIEGSKKLKGIVVSPSTPRKESGVYWGYSVRLADSITEVVSKCPYKDGYDLIIGTSDKGESVDNFICPEFYHLLIVFGGLQGLEAALESDSVFNVDNLFHHYLNTLPGQGSRTIRTEEAMLISLATLRPKLKPKYKPLKFVSDQFQVEIVGPELN